MNKRIEELANEAMLFSHKNGGWRISTHVPDDFKEKFAELIIQEFINFGHTWEGWKPDYLVKRHFGIEK